MRKNSPPTAVFRMIHLREKKEEKNHERKKKREFLFLLRASALGRIGPKFGSWIMGLAAKDAKNM